MTYVAKKQPLPEKDQASIIAACDDDTDRLLVLVLLDTGLRLPEWSEIRPKNLQDAFLKVGARTLALTARTKRLLAARFGNGESRMPLRNRAAEYRLQMIAGRAGIKTKVTPDVLRRTFARNAVQGGMDPSTLRAHLNTSVEATARLFMTYDRGGGRS
jgi:integrase